MSNEPIKVALLDGDPLIIQLLKEFLEEQNTPSYQVVLTASEGQEFIQQLANLEEPLDFLILELKLKNGDGLYVLKKLKERATALKVVVLTSYYRPAYIGQMIKLGAHAFLHKEIDKEELLEVLLAIQKKGHYWSPEEVKILEQQMEPRHNPNLKITLTQRELEVLQLIAQQKNTKEIAHKLFISPKTVEAHKSKLLFKTGARNMAGLIMFAIQNKLIDPDDLIVLG